MALEDRREYECSLLPIHVLSHLTVTIITASPERWHEGAEPKLLSGLLRARPDRALESLDGWIMHIVLRCIHFSEEPCRSGLDELYTSVFARSIATVVCSVMVNYEAHSLIDLGKQRDTMLCQLKQGSTATARQRARHRTRDRAVTRGKGYTWWA